MKNAVVTVPVALLTNKALDDEDIVVYARVKAHLSLKNHTASVQKLISLGFLQPIAKPVPVSMDAIKRKVEILAQLDKTPYLQRLTFVQEHLVAVGQEATLQVLVYHLKNRIEQKINQEGNKMQFFLSKEWVNDNRREALKLYRQYPYRAEKWEQIIDWFFHDEFWRDVITTVKALNRHLHNYVSWERKTHPSTSKRTLHIIGG